MTGDAAIPPNGLDVGVASQARIYDWLLGGKHNYPADRAVGRQVLKIAPEIKPMAWANWEFRCRVTGYVVGVAGIRQILDIGSGLPTARPVHEVAAAHDPNTRVVYVDNDATALVHSQHILASQDRATIIRADLRDPPGILDHPQFKAMIGLSRPVAVLILAVTHMVGDEVYGHVQEIKDALPAGSYLALSAAADTNLDRLQAVLSVTRASFPDLTLRSPAGIARFFDGFEWVEPGLTNATHWRNPTPDPDADEWLLAGLARKP